MKHEDDFESDLDDFDNDDLWNHLNRSWSFNALERLDDDEIMDYLEEQGYDLNFGKKDSDSLDYVDATMLEEIENLFLNSSCVQRLEMYNKIIKL